MTRTLAISDDFQLLLGMDDMDGIQVEVSRTENLVILSQRLMQVSLDVADVPVLIKTLTDLADRSR